MSFGDLTTRAGAQALNNFLADKSYLDGYQATTVDNEVFDAMKKAPDGDLFHALRWFNHINSFSESERKAFVKSSKSLKDFTDAASASKGGDDDDDIDLFGSDDEDDEKQKKVREERLKAYEAKKSKKPALIAKSIVTLGVSPWDDETDLNKMADLVKAIQMDGLVWGKFEFVPVAYGLKKLKCVCVIEDDKVSTVDLEDQIAAFEDYVQSVDILSFQKL
jgi:elongation factor 1-beta